MAWTARLKHKRRLGMIINNCDVALGYLKEFIEEYEPIHPREATWAKVIAQMFIELQNCVSDLQGKL